MNHPESQGSEEGIVPQDKLGKPEEGVQSAEKIPIQVNDLRDPSAIAFDLDKYLTVISRLRTEGLFKISREFQDSDYGKYMSIIASSESNHWADAVKKATAIEITLTTPASKGHAFLEGRTHVEVKVLMGEREGRAFTFYFNKEGKYASGGWDDKYFEKQLGEAAAEDEQKFTLKVSSDSAKKELK